MMRALEDLDRVDAGKAPRRGLRPEVRSVTDRWVHGNTAKVASTYAKAGSPVVVPLRPRSRRPWVIALIVLLVITGLIAAIPGARHQITKSWKSMTSGPQRILPAVAVTTHGAYVFENMSSGPGPRVPVTYRPCQAIRYTVNSDLAPAGTDGIIPTAVAEVSRLTGLKFEYAGVSHTPVNFSRPTGPAAITATYPPAQIGWSEASVFTGRGADVVGLGGSEYVTEDGFSPHYVTGSVALRADSLGQILRQRNGRAEVTAVVLHELGHLVGLAHVKDSHELMYAKNDGQLDFGPGDREGLALLGQGSCT
ncbi:hypothetical protein Back2_10380 [Nocardioides baekrokdamisoli]|uniref:Peptidase M10 metallopeptidase domain-containing protein n=2 Tax=Nocardioides baekrokdamisoli TaxID=1804624 RepID=A0A3G9IT06_9ACTN|nr:hypothetical protein Back2_10380 [Nocardioides baekrokdamisoli]